jgi:pimeloyl-ACP methyl ester carboxylesterase
MAAKSAPTSHSYVSQRLRLHYLDWGNEDAPHLLLVHGNRDHAHNWDWVAQALRDDYHIVAPDLRGHGDSEWAVGSTYASMEFVYDLAQLVHQARLAPVCVIAHSLGGVMALRYAGLYPENVSKLVVIEGTGVGWRRSTPRPVHERLRRWIDDVRSLSGRAARRYPTLDAAFERMHEANRHLTAEQARHLTIHGSDQNEDGSFTWKFDNYMHAATPYDMPEADARALWRNISCPVLLVAGSESFARGSRSDAVLANFRDARQVVIDDAGHWVHHDQLDEFLRVARAFLRA